MSIYRRILRVLKWAGIGLAGLVTILLIINAVAVWITSSQVECRLAAIRAAGDPISIADFHTEAVAPEKDAVTYLRRAQSDAEALSAELAPLWKNHPEQRIYLDDAEIKAIESAFAAYPKVIPLLEQAANCTGYSMNFGKDAANTVDAIEALMENAQEGRMFARLLCQYRFFVLLSKNKHDEAVQSSITLLKLCRLLEKDPTFINFLVNACACRGIAIRCANEALQAGPVSDNSRQELENELAKIDMRQAYLQAMKSERAFSLDRFEEMYSQLWPSRVFLNRETLGCLDVYDWIITRATAALPENASNPPANISPTPPSSGVLGQLLLPSLKATETAANRVEAQIRVIRVINALGRRNNQENPQKPPLADLSDLGLPKSATTDPFNGKPLIVKKVDGGWLVYSVGENKVDDGGELEEESGTGKQLDIGLRPVIRTKAVAG